MNREIAPFKGAGQSGGRVSLDEDIVLRSAKKRLAEGKINHRIKAKYPILEARKANELFESGQVTGNVVLLSPELL